MHSLSTLAICLFLSTSNGFGPSASSIHRLCSAPSKLDRTFVNAMDSETTEERSSKIQQMSWFLTTLLLETALKEAAKGEDKSKISMDEIQKLADVLQRTEEDILQRSTQTSVAETDGTTTGEEQVLPIEKNTETDTANTRAEVQDSSQPVVGEGDRIFVEEESKSTLGSQNLESSESLMEASTALIKEDTTERKEVEHLEQTEIELGIDVKEEKQDFEPIEQSIAESETLKAAEMEVGTAGAEKVDGNVSQRHGAARIPDVISRAYGRSLEVISSAVPPLRNSSIPKGSAESLSTKTSHKLQNGTPGEDVESIAAVATTSSTNGLMSLEHSSKPSSAKSESEAKLDAKYAASSEDQAFEVLKDSGMVEIHEWSPDISLSKEKPPSCTDSIVRQESITYRKGSDEKDETASIMGTVSTEHSATEKLRPIASILPEQSTARKQPTKKNLSQDDFSAKYAVMTLEDRAFEILKDLDMIEIHEFPTKALSAVQEEQDYPGVVESCVRRFDEIQDRPAHSMKKQTPSKRERFFRPIQRVFRKSRDRLVGTQPSRSVTTPPSVSEAVKRARQQPKSPSEEALLAEKYGRLAVEDRAYAILSDLGMIESV